MPPQEDLGPTKPKRRPTRGPSWRPRSPRAYLHAHAAFRHLAPIGPYRFESFLSRLGMLFGDEPARLTVTGLPPAAWKSDLPWREVMYATELRLPTLEFARPEIWAEISAHITTTFWTLEARRGGGKSRHLLWSLKQPELANHTCEFRCAAWYLGPEDASATRVLLSEFFAGVEATGDCILGEVTTSVWTEFWDPCQDDRMSSVHGWISRAVERIETTSPEPRLCGLSATTYLLPWLVERLGGAEALIRSLTQRVANMTGPRGSGLERLTPDAIRDRLTPLSRGALVECRPLGEMLEFLQDPDSYPGLGPQENDAASVCFVLAVLDAVREVDGLAFTSPDLLSRHLSALSRLEDLVGKGWRLIREARPPEVDHLTAEDGMSAKAISAEDNRAYLESHPPTCINGACRPVAEDRSRGSGLRQFVAFDLGASSKSQAVPKPMAVYVRGGEWFSLVAPVLVGSTDPARACLAFNPLVDGWDGAHRVSNDPNPPEIGRLKQLTCPQCQGRLFRAQAAFEIVETDDLTSSELERRQDLYTWFSLHIACVSCPWTTALDHECA